MMRLIRHVERGELLNRAYINLRGGYGPAMILYVFGRFWKVRIVPREIRSEMPLGGLQMSFGESTLIGVIQCVCLQDAES